MTNRTPGNHAVASMLISAAVAWLVREGVLLQCPSRRSQSLLGGLWGPRGGCPGSRGTWGGGPPPDACLAV